MRTLKDILEDPDVDDQTKNVVIISEHISKNSHITDYIICICFTIVLVWTTIIFHKLEQKIDKINTGNNVVSNK